MKRQIYIKDGEFGHYPDIKLVAGDVNAYEIVAKHTEDISNCAMTVKVTMTGKEPIQDMGTVSGNVGRCTLKNNMYDTKGYIEVWAAIVAEDGTTVTQGSVMLEVISSGQDADISGDDRVPALTQIMADVQQLNGVAQEAAQEAKTSEINAKEAEDTVTQAMSDMMSMMGTDIATLEGGKIPVSQIPPIALTHTSTVGSIAEMQALTAEDGDFCRIVSDGVVEATYAYVVSNGVGEWIPCNQNSCAEADHALAADTATNATKINGHRIIVFDTVTEFGNAVKENGTLYLVGEVV